MSPPRSTGDISHRDRPRRVRPRVGVDARRRRLAIGCCCSTCRSPHRANTSALDLADPGVYPITVQIRRDGHARRRRHHVPRARPHRRDHPRSAVVGRRRRCGRDRHLADRRRSSRHARQQLTALAELAETRRRPAHAAHPCATGRHRAGRRSRARRTSAGRRRRRLRCMATTDLPLDPSSATAAGIKDEFVRRLRDGEAKLVDAVAGADATQRSLAVRRGRHRRPGPAR